MHVLQTASVPAPWPLFTDKETEAEGCESVSRALDGWVSWLPGHPLLPLEPPHPECCCMAAVVVSSI